MASFALLGWGGRALQRGPGMLAAAGRAPAGTALPPPLDARQEGGVLAQAGQLLVQLLSCGGRAGSRWLAVVDHRQAHAIRQGRGGMQPLSYAAAAQGPRWSHSPPPLTHTFGLGPTFAPAAFAAPLFARALALALVPLHLLPPPGDRGGAELLHQVLQLELCLVDRVCHTLPLLSLQ